ncbi:MAG: hypothetical protein K6G88_08790 [Lachnospiraceae bacterium]|nr:hypothetical protein [Lachnospiraceae bacterium]
MKKIIAVILVVVVLLSGSLGIFSLYRGRQNEQFIDKYVSASQFSEKYGKPEKNAAVRMLNENVCLTIKALDLFSKEGNLSVFDNSTSEYLIIWENLKTSERSYRVIIRGKDGEVTGVDFDASGKLYNSSYQYVIDENKDRINEFLNIAKEEWGIDDLTF